jgi:antitoxin component of MazEF toxin-antitoxin module
MAEHFAAKVRSVGMSRSVTIDADVVKKMKLEVGEQIIVSLSRLEEVMEKKNESR